MKRMNCKLLINGKECGVLIDYDAETKTAREVQSGQKHIHEKPKSWTKKEFKPQETDLRIAAHDSEIKAIWKSLERLDMIEETMRGIIRQISFKTGDEV